jgi:hypothetical protein
MIEISHGPAEGTLVTGTARGDGSAAVLKATGFRWGRSIGCWFRPQSRDRAPNLYKIQQAVAGLNAAGFEVNVSVDAGPRDIAQAEEDRADRAEARSERLADRGQRHSREAAAHLKAQQGISDHIPFGQPILVGHHSEKRHRADLRRMDQHADKFLAEHRAAERDGHAAEVAADHMAFRENPIRVARRIERLETDVRRTRALLERRSSAQLEANLAHATSQLEYWTDVRDKQVAAGARNHYGPSDVHRGDRVQARGYWRTVARVNRTTVSVETGYSWTDRVPFYEITGLESPAAKEAI